MPVEQHVLDTNYKHLKEREREREREIGRTVKNVEKCYLSSCFLSSRSLPVRKSIVIKHRILQLYQKIILGNSVQRSQRCMQLPEVQAQKQLTLIIKPAFRHFNTFF